MTRSVCRALLLLLVCGLSVGCSPPAVESGPSYAELVKTYNEELRLLDRLESKRETLIREYVQTTAPDQSAEALARLEGLLQSARDLKDSDAIENASDPNELLDRLTEQNASAEEIAGQALNELLGGGTGDGQDAASPPKVVVSEERKAAFEASLSALDEEIAQQKERVERARQARDSAEAAADAS